MDYIKPVTGNLFEELNQRPTWGAELILQGRKLGISYQKS